MLGDVRGPRFRLSRSRAVAPGRAPCFGADTAADLLGYGQARIDALGAAGVLR